MKKGIIQQLRGQNYAFAPPAWIGLYHKRGQKQTFIDPLAPHLVRIVIE